MPVSSSSSSFAMTPRQTPSRRQNQRGAGGRVTTKINNSTNNNKKGKGRGLLSTIIVYLMVGVMFIYVTTMVALTRYTTTTTTNTNKLRNLINNKQNQNDPTPYKTQYSREEWGDRNHPYKAKREWGHGVEPEQIIAIGQQQQQQVQSSSVDEEQRNPYNQKKKQQQQQPERILTAYVEPIDQSTWKSKPLPQRTWTSEDLQLKQYPNVNSCQNLPSQWPVDDPPTNDDPFLPWIHDVFPTHDGQFIQFVAQNKHRCRTGSTQEEKDTMAHMKPQVALFQHVAIKRVGAANTTATTKESEQRYKLVDHSEADPDGMATRFICRFQPSGEETLSVFNFLYEYASYRKKSRFMFHEDTGDNKLIHTSQLTFLCPVPPNLQSQIRTGESVIDDFATLFVDLIPIRTPPRYGPPNEFFPPYYKEFRAQGDGAFNPTIEWGNNHLLPTIENSGRWENIPICKPSLAQYGKKSTELTKENSMGITPPIDDSQKAIVVDGIMDTKPLKAHNAVQTHRLVSCLWASTGYATRGNRFAINDGQRRLLEWIEYNKLIGVEHFYLYDNSGAFGNTNNINLRPISDMFPDDITVINWPSKVCNNNPNNVDSVGERSSQYAAEASCRLRFGPHVSWIQQFDLDEYLVPMGNLTSIHPILDKLENEGKKIVSFGSWRAWPRRRFIEDPNKSRLSGAKYCGRNTDCFQLKVPMNYTILQAYNCDRQKPGNKKERMPAEKQLYKPEYVKHHFIHYSTVTVNSILNREDTNIVLNHKFKDKPFPDPLSRFGDEVNEALMLHTKAVATQDTIFWESACNATYDGKAFCRLGSPFPDDMTGVDESKGDEGWKMNCYVNNKIEDYWVKMLDSQLKQHVPEIAMRLAQEEEH